METLTGEVKEIIYVNDANGYTIADFETDTGNETTIVGYLPFITLGSSLKVVGNFVMHKDYGRQFKVETFEVIVPQNLTQLEKYIGNGLISGIGPATAKRIIKTFGEDTLAVLKFEPEKLAEVKGITLEKAEKISVEFNESLGLWEIVSYLGKLGIEPKNAQSIYKKLGQETIEKVQENPYILVDLGIRVDFHQIDRMAMQIGFEKTNLKRIDCGILHALNLSAGNGHSCVLEENLIRYVSSLLGISEEDVADGINDLIAKEKIVIETREKINWVYQKEYYDAESNIVRNIVSLEEADNIKAFKNLNKRIKDTCTIDLSKEQLDAIKLVNDNNVTIITGGPGTGKTTIIKVIIELYDSLKKKVVLCAPTGRAAKRMTEATGKDASTLHRLLEIGKVEDNGMPKADMPISPIDADVIVVDEMSMVDLFLMNYLLKGIYKGTKLIMVGDSDQLPSVGPGTVLKDLIESKKIPCISLNKIFRQAAKSQIIVNAHKVNEGISFIGEKEDANNSDALEDFEFVAENNQERAKEIILKNYKLDTQIITPTKKGSLGTKELNKLIQEKFNPFYSKDAEKKYGDVIFRQGDRVMQTKNNYDIEWVKLEKEAEFGSGIFNGEMGTITSVNNLEGLITIQFEDGKMAGYQNEDLEQLVHSYAITVHKSQGSEFEKVIMPILDVPSMLLTRNVLYTGMTRAKSDLKIIGIPDMVEFMINNNKTKERNTGLKYKLVSVRKD